MRPQVSDPLHMPSLQKHKCSFKGDFVNNTLEATDPDGAFSGKFEIYDCEDALNTKNTAQCLFAIPPSTATVLLNSDVPDEDFDLDFEIKSQYHLGIKVTDTGGLSSFATITVQVTDVNDAPLSTSDTLTSAT